MRSFGWLRLVVGFFAGLVLVSLFSVNAIAQNPPCTLTVTPASGFAPLSVSATGTCNGGFTPSTMDWGDGSPQESFPPNSGTATLNHTYTSTGTLLATLTALDVTGAPFTTSQQVTVQSPVACKLTMNPSRGAAPLNTTANGICSSVNSTITSVTVDFGNGDPPSSANGSTITASDTYTQVGQFTASITGTDSNGQTGSRFQSVNVTTTPFSLPPAPVNGDVYVSGDTGLVERHNSKGTLVDVLPVSTNQSNTLGAMAFDSNRTLFVADRSGGDDTSFANAYYFDQSGTAQTFTNQFTLTGTGTLVFDIAGNIHVGGIDSNNAPNIQKLDSFARVLFNYAPANNPQNPAAIQWMDLATDQCTMFYTDSTNLFSVRRFDVCKNSQLADFTTSLPGTAANDVRIRPNGEVLVADTSQVVRLDATGKPIQTYGGPQGAFIGLALDPDNASFWATQRDGSVTRFDIASGSVLSRFNASFTPAEGVAVFGEIRAATNTPPSCTVKASPSTGTAPLNVTVTGSCTPGVNPITSTVLDFGDGTTQTATSGTHIYKTAGAFTIKLTATSTFGLTSSASQTVTVSAPPIVTPPGIIPSGLFVSFGGGTIKQVSITDGSVIRTLSTGLGGTIAGMAFDQFGTLYATDFTAGNVSKFDILGTPLGTFGSAYDCQPESIVFDGAGNVYVGQQGCNRTVLKFGPNGQLLAEFRVTVEKQGADQIELSADQCTLFYTSEGPSILRYNVCTGQQLPVFANSLTRALTLRILSDGGVLVTDEKDIIRLDASGQKVTTYTAPGEQCWDGLTLDPDRTSFWAADFCTSNIYKFDIASGRQLAKFNPGAPSGSIFAIAMGGTGLNVGGVGFAGALTASPQTASLASGQSATFNISFTALQSAVGQNFQLSCANLPPSLKCSFSPPSITPGTAGPAGNSTLTISALTTAALSPAREWMLAGSLGVVPGIVLMTLPVTRRRRTRLLISLGLITATLLATSCGGGHKPKPAGTASKGSFTVLVIGNAGQLQASTPINVSVQ
jgi:PKD repeat protein